MGGILEDVAVLCDKRLSQATEELAKHLARAQVALPAVVHGVFGIHPVVRGQIYDPGTNGGAKSLVQDVSSPIRQDTARA